MAYEAAKGMLEAAGVPVVEVGDAEAKAVVGDKKTPVAGLPNRANEKQTSGSILAAHVGGSSSNANDSRNRDAKLINDTQSAKNKINKYVNGDFDIDTTTLSKAMSGIGSLLSMRNRGGSRYAVLQTDGGNTIAVRLSDHAANGNNFGQDNAENNLSIVIERRRFDAMPSEIEFTEASIPLATFESQPKAVVYAIVKGVEDVLADRSFILSPEIGIVEKKGNTAAETSKMLIQTRDKAYMEAVQTAK